MEGTSGRQRVSAESVADYEFDCPAYEEQKQIGTVLRSLDDRITLLRETNRTLEDMARLLFRAWFVDFEPVRAKMEGRTPTSCDAIAAALFPDRLVESELGEIPEGWSCGTLGQVAEHPRRSVKPEAMSANDPYIGLEHMPRKSISLDAWSTAEELESNKYAFSRGEILFGKLRPYFHKVGLAPLDGVCSTDILVITPQSPDLLAFCLLLVSSDEFVRYTDGGSGGTRMPRTSWAEMKKYPHPLPPANIAAAYNTAVQPLLSRLLSNLHLSRNLGQARDELLPRLMSGSLKAP
jgi:type I restriction enzyme S subunit